MLKAITKIIIILVISVYFDFFVSAHVQKEHGYLDVSKIASLSLFYNPITNQTLHRRPIRPAPLALVPFASPCSCNGPTCTCCAGVRVYGIFDREACAILTYRPEERMIDMDLRMNNNSIFNNKFSTQDQQLCLPVIPISLVGPVDFCVKLYDMNVVEQRVHACLAMLVRFSQYPFLTLQFNCMEMGVGSIGFSRPGSISTDSPITQQSNVTYETSTATSATTQISQLDSEVYDTVSENISRENRF